MGLRTAGPRWRALFDATWPAYRRWYLPEGLEARPSLIEAASTLARHMPELLPTWARLSQQTGSARTFHVVVLYQNQDTRGHEWYDGASHRSS